MGQLRECLPLAVPCYWICSPPRLWRVCCCPFLFLILTHLLLSSELTWVYGHKATASKHNLDPCLCFHLSVSHNCQWNFCQLLKNSGFMHLWSDEAWLVMWCLSCLTHWKVFDCFFSVSKHHAGVFMLLCKIWLKYDRNSGQNFFCIVVCPKCWTDYLILFIYPPVVPDDVFPGSSWHKSYFWNVIVELSQKSNRYVCEVINCLSEGSLFL